MLVQDRDIGTWEKFECVTKAQFPKNKEDLARFTWLVTKHTKSNAIVMCYEYKPGYFQVMGLGPGQPNRIDSNLRLCQPRVRDNVARLPEAKEFFDENGKLTTSKLLMMLAFVTLFSRVVPRRMTSPSNLQTSSALRWCSPECATSATNSL